jgi:hypothetical protein
MKIRIDNLVYYTKKSHVNNMFFDMGVKDLSSLPGKQIPHLILKELLPVCQSLKYLHETSVIVPELL